MIDQMTGRLRSKKTFESAVQIILDDVIALHGAEFGIVQLPIGDELLIVAQRGFTKMFLDTFGRVGKNDGSISGRAMRSGAPVVIRDVLEDEGYAAFRADAVKAGYRGVQSTPLITKDRDLVGVVSTLFASPHEPTPIEMDILKAYSEIAAGYAFQFLDDKTLAAKAARMNQELYNSGRSLIATP